MLEAPDQRNLKRKDMRIVGGCRASHTPWFVYLHILVPLEAQYDACFGLF
jgi:hypothetical protein